MLTYTACASCRDTLVVEQSGHDTHADCFPPQDATRTLIRQLHTCVAAGDDDGAERCAAALEQLENAPPRLADAARVYAAYGWPVFPCLPGLKTPATSHGFKDATTDAATITAWWERWPTANIGLATGHTFDVIDVDPAGRDWWTRLCTRYAGHAGPLPDFHGQTHTPRNGLHVYIEPTHGGNLTKISDGVDYRGRGGYVVAPPSILTPAAYREPVSPHARLNYSWITHPSPAILATATVST